MNKRWMKKSAAICAVAMLIAGQAATAEEKRLGDYVYVPAMQVSHAAGSISLRVEGLALESGTDIPNVVEALSGAEFGVYVFSGTGELTPWANPLYPSEPMRIRTGEGETLFSLPQGAEFYLRQESAPQGYIFDDETLIPVTGDQIVVRNAMAGELLISAVDSLGNPVCGVDMQVTAQDGTVSLLTTDEQGQAIVYSDVQQGFVVEEAALPEGVFAARGVSGGEVGEAGVYAFVEPANRTRVVFEHPASGSVLLDMRLSVLDDNAQPSLSPLEGVRLDIASEPPMSIVTDEQGQARASLLEGTYQVCLSYEGGGDVILPITEGQMIVSSGSTTVIELSAVQASGRIVVLAPAGKGVGQSSVSLVSEENGDKYGPYVMDAEGMAVSQPLPAGTYRISEFSVDAGMQFGSIACGDMRAQAADELVLTVTSGQITTAEIELLTRERQSFALVSESLNEQGEIMQQPISEALRLTLIAADGTAAAELEALQGNVRVEALSGEYALSMLEADAVRLGLQRVSETFELPSDAEAISFASENTRLILSSVDENGEPAAGAVYQLTDSTGARFEVTCDKDGMAVTPLLSPGVVLVETLDAPAGHAPAAQHSVLAEAGVASRVQIKHETHGSVQIAVQMKSLNEFGGAVYAPVTSMPVRIYRVTQDGQLTDTGIELVSDEAGQVQISLEAGEYAAAIDEQMLADGCRAGDAVRFAVKNMQASEERLVCLDALGGVQVRLTGGELDDKERSQMRFELVAEDGEVHALLLTDSVFYAGSLEQGRYLLRQTQIPQGYTLASERTVQVSGGEIAHVDVPLEEYAVLTVSKTGLTFDQMLKTFIVPLSGEYGVYMLADGEMKPYPSEDAQMTLWANVTPQEIAQGKAGSAKLPAAIDGTTYYLHELTAAPGFAADENYYEVILRAGEETTLSCAVSSDRGFFKFDALDAQSGMHVPGGAYELTDAESGEVVLSFEMGDEPYQNPMAVPVGAYVLRQKTAAQGYALSVPSQMDVLIEPYLTEGGTVTAAAMHAVRIPSEDPFGLIEEVYTAAEQNLTLVCVETGSTAQGEKLLAPSVTIHVNAAGEERTDIASVAITGAEDVFGSQYVARVEYCLDGGGWQPSDARMTNVLSGPAAVSLSDVHDDISAVRVTYLDAITGEEAVAGGFTPGQISLSVEASAQGNVNMQAYAEFDGVFAYQTEMNGRVSLIRRSSAAQTAFVMQSSDLFDTVSAGRDGHVTGVAFFDEDADGVMDGSETGRYAGLTVTLQTISGDVVDTARTGSDGTYAFSAISAGEYMIQFDAGDTVVFSKGELYSDHVISSIRDMRYGASEKLVIDGDHTDYVVNVGCIFASGVTGTVLESIEGGEHVGFAGLNVEMRAADAFEDDEPLVVVTGGMGEFSFGRILPGKYEISVEIPQDYLCRSAENGRLTEIVDLTAGDTLNFGSLLLEKAVGVYGSVFVDDNGDGVIEENAHALEGVRVALLSTDGVHTERVADTVTDENGAYAFENQYPGAYCVLFELDGEWAFTRYGEDSSVYGAVSQNGTTRTIYLEPGQTAFNVNAGTTIPAKLTVLVFKDTQYDGQKGTYEEMLSDVTVSLIRLENGEDAEEVSYTTDDNGEIVFDGVSPGEYVIAYQMPGQWRSTKQVDPESTNYPVSFVPQSAVSSGRSLPFSLGMGSSETRLYIGAMLSGSLSGTVYYDDDADAKMDEGEALCAGVDVELINGSGETVASAITGEEGSYRFEGLAPGRYTVRFTAEQDCGFSGTERTAARGGVLESDSNVSSTRSISVTGGQMAASADAGVVRLGSVSGLVWEDKNADRLPSDYETGMAGLNVHLMDGAGRNILRSTHTDAQGRFTFGQLKPATYKLRVDTPQGHVFSGAQDGSLLPLESERDGRGYSAAFALLGGAHVDQIGYGLLTQGTISGVVWEDNNYDGLMASGEQGLRGASVTLVDAHGMEIASRQTVRSGEFTFDQVMPGAYSIRVTLPEGYDFTASGGESLAGEDAWSGTLMDIGTLAMGSRIADVRIGALKAASIGGVVWLDQDDDGHRQNGDDGVYGVRAVLEMTGGADAGRIFETTTGIDGAYRFDGVMPGTARITFEVADGQAFAKQVSGARRVSSVPKTDALAAQTDEIRISAGENRQNIDVGVVGVGTISGMVWEDSTYNGKMDQNEAGIADALVELIEKASGDSAASARTNDSGAYTIGFVRKGEYVLRVTLPDGRIFTKSGDSGIAEVDACEGQTASFALLMGESMENVHFGAILPAVLTGRVAIDENEDGLCSEQESGLEGAVVTAMQGGTVVATAYANEDGSFAFDTLRPGTYRLRYVLDAESLFAKDVQLNLTVPDAYEAETSEYTLVMGQTEQVPAVPVIYAARIAGKAWMDENVNGSIDSGEAAMCGVSAELLSADGDMLASVSVDSDGHYAFDRLRSGSYAIRFILPSDVLFTDYTGNAGDSCVPSVAGFTGQTQMFALEMGEEKPDMNVGGILPGEIGDTVWLDKDGNGLQDYKEPLLAGVKLKLMRVQGDGSMEEAAEVSSDEYGYYAFESLRPGTYVLCLEQGMGKTLTFSFGEPLGEIDSDLNPDTGMSAPIALQSGQTLRNIDVGLTEYAN
ncbi:MAG: carboxypeptidase regulatory-like domain-containing protein [Clostridia bacterium]|nr:carboxypeptidase regulatory-like domain-containing protein [Clostridia bacterium]